MSFDSFDLNAILAQMGRDKGINKTVLIEAIESAMLSAARKHYGHNLNLETQFNEESGEIEVIQFKAVVERVEDDATQINLPDARREYDPEAIVGDEIGRKLDTAVLGRIAAQTAKQVIIQKVRDAERDVIFEEFKNCKGDLINGIVQRYDRGNLIVNLGRTEAILPKREQISRERYRQGDRIRGMILDIDRSARGPQVVLSRSHPDFLRKLFEIEVPEVLEKVVEIKNVAREPGERAKIAVYSNDTNIDPVGACVGVKGSRVESVVQELRGERIDIITWTPDQPSYVARALRPAEVARVVVDEDGHSMEVVVPDEQLSVAIGRRGQNVKLASKLTGWKIDVRSVSVAEEESKRARQSLEAIPGLQFTDAELLFQNGYRSAREVAEATLEELSEVFSAESASQIHQASRSHVEKLEDTGATEPVESEGGASDLDRLMLAIDVRDRLVAAGHGSIPALAVLDEEQLREVPGMTEEEVVQVKEAVESFLKTGTVKSAHA